MGLNMDVDHVAFAALKKFDGNVRRDLRADELGQIAGRAGRHMNEGTFGVTGDVTGLDPETVQAIENHQYDPVRQIFWRTPTLDYSDLGALVDSLKKGPNQPGLARVREPDDERPPGNHAGGGGDQRVQIRSTSVCLGSVPGAGLQKNHRRGYAFVGSYFYTSSGKALPADWIADEVARLNRPRRH